MMREDVVPVDGEPILSSYDIILANSSAGKDSLAMLWYLNRLASRQGLTKRIIVVHADLGRVEWASTAELAERQAVRPHCLNETNCNYVNS